MKILIDDRYCKGCNLCIAVCPKEALLAGTQRTQKGYLMPAAVPEKCTQCMNCEIICPDFAITVVKEDE